MGDEMYNSSRPDSKRKSDDQTALPRRASGFSSPASDTRGSGPTPPSYNNVPPPPDGFELAKQRAQEIAAKLFSEAEAKRPRLDNGGGGGSDSGEKSFGYGSNEYFQKPVPYSVPSQGGTASLGSFPAYGFQVSSKKIEIPNGKVGVIIGKGGETIKRLQADSGAKIQVTRDTDADPHSQTRPVELLGRADQIRKAEDLIADVLAEADVGGSSLNASRTSIGSQTGSEHFSMKVPNNKVGLIIGKGGEMIKSMQMKSGARIQLIPLHLPPGDTSTERTVHIDGTKECIELAKELVNEVIGDNRARNPPNSGGYPQRGYAPPQPPVSWAPPGQPPLQQPGYGYTQPGAYPAQPPQYGSTQLPYGAYQTTHQTAPGSGYDYYSQQQQPPQQPSSGAFQQPAAISSASTDTSAYYMQPPSSYNPQGPYGDSTYPQSAGHQQSYGQDAFSGPYHSQSGSNPQSVYQQGYGVAPAYGANQDGPNSNYSEQSGSTHQSSSQSGYSAPQQVSPHSGYKVPPPASQFGFASQPQSAYGQPPYVQSPQGQKQTPAPQVYGQGTQAVYGPPAYGQNQPAYGQQPQPTYADPYGGSGGQDVPAAPSSSSGGAKASPQN